MAGRAQIPDETLESVGENIDKLISIAPVRGLIHTICRAAKEEQGAPPALLAAKELASVIGKGDVVIIATGFPVLPHNRGEQDGPVGAATLARALVVGLGARPIIVTETINVQLVEASLAAATLYARSLDDALRLPACAAVVDFPKEVERARELGDTLLSDLKPKALIAIERAGANENGHYHNAHGKSMTPYVSKPDYMFAEARRKGILTVGIGDLGNELGSVKIKDAILDALPTARRCKCPCQGSIVPATETDVLVMAGTSNWGAWGIEACLAAILGRPDVLHNSDVNQLVHQQCALAGGNDGPRHLLIPGTDAIPLYFHRGLIQLMGYVVERSLEYEQWLSFPWLSNL